MPARLEHRRLTVVRTTRLDPIVRPNRNLDRHVLVAIEVSDEKHVLAVLVRPPALERREDGLVSAARAVRAEAGGCAGSGTCCPDTASAQYPTPITAARAATAGRYDFIGVTLLCGKGAARGGRTAPLVER